MAPAAPPRVLIFHSCANFCFFHGFSLKVFGLFCAMFGIFASFAQFLAFFAHILCANFSDSKFCVCYFVSFFHLWCSSMYTSTCLPVMYLITCPRTVFVDRPLVFLLLLPSPGCQPQCSRCSPCWRGWAPSYWSTRLHFWDLLISESSDS